MDKNIFFVKSGNMRLERESKMNRGMYFRNFFYLVLFALIVIGCHDESNQHAHTRLRNQNNPIKEVEVIDVKENTPI